MFHKKSIVLVAILLQILIQLSPAAADELAATSRRLFQKHQKAVVKVSLVIRFRLFMNGNERKSRESATETTGTVLTPSGLTLISLNTTEPDKIADEKLKRKTDAQLKLESELGDIKIILYDGREIPAEIVLRDRDLDLAFLRPSSPLKAPLDAIGSVKIARQLQPADNVLIIGRMGRLGNREAALSIDRIHAVLKKPRTLYLPSFARELGAPVLSENGDWVGNILLKFNPMSNTSLQAMFIILPAGDILEVAGQAPPIDR